jgi:hypothetical protein
MELKVLWQMKKAFQISLCLLGLMVIGGPGVFAKKNDTIAVEASRVSSKRSKDVEKSQTLKAVTPKDSVTESPAPRCVELIKKEYQDLQRLKSKQQKKEHFLQWYERFSQTTGPDPLKDMEGSLEWNECVLMLGELEGALRRTDFSCEDTWDKLEFLFPPAEEGKPLSSLKAIQPLLFELCR